MTELPFRPGGTDAGSKMPWTVMLSIVLIGAGAVSAAVVGLLLPENHWVGAGLSLVLGAGVGVVVLSIGLFAVGSTSTTGAQGAFLAASAAGLLAVIGALSILWRRVKSPKTFSSRLTSGRLTCLAEHPATDW